MTIKKIFFKITHWETWHYMLKYIPIMPVWAWHCIRARSLWFFTPSNPTLSFGGFEGETKSEMYNQLPPGSYPKSIYIDPGIDFEDIHSMMLQAGLNFPIAAKPDAGMMGLMFRKVDDEAAMQSYHAVMPGRYIIQELIAYPLEVSVFYYRHPARETGTISGFVKKEFLAVTGNGKATLLELINRYDAVQFRLDEMKAKHAGFLQKILPEGQSYILSYALNLSRGGRLISLSHEIDAALLAVFDKISLYTKHFYYGRYDIKCASIQSLKEGKDFSILEYNGCGAEPHHAYGNHHSLLQAYKIFIQHWRVLAAISSYNHQHGFPRCKFMKGYRYLAGGKKNFRLLKKIDKCVQL